MKYEYFLSIICSSEEPKMHQNMHFGTPTNKIKFWGGPRPFCYVILPLTPYLGTPWFRQMPWMLWFCQNATVLRFHKNILFLMGIIWSLLCEFNTKKYLHFLCLCYQSPCALLLTGGICDHDVIIVCILPKMYICLELETMSFSKLAAI